MAAKNKELEDFQARLKKLKDKFKAGSKSSRGNKGDTVAYIKNDLEKTYIGRYRGLEKEIPESMSDAMQAGEGADSKKDVEKDKDVKKMIQALEVTHSNICDAIAFLSNGSMAAKGIERDTKKLKMDVERTYGKSKPEGPDKKAIEELLKDAREFDALIADFAKKAVVPAEALKIQKEDPKKKFEEFFKAAEKLPKKKVEPLPPELEKVGFAKLKVEIKEQDRALKSAESDLEKLIKDAKDDAKKTKGDEPAKFVDAFKVKAAEVSDKSDKLEKAQKKCKIAIAKAAHIKDLPTVIEVLRRQASKYKATYTKLKQALAKAE